MKKCDIVKKYIEFHREELEGKYGKTVIKTQAFRDRLKDEIIDEAVAFWAKGQGLMEDDPIDWKYRAILLCRANIRKADAAREIVKEKGSTLSLEEKAYLRAIIEEGETAKRVLYDSGWAVDGVTGVNISLKHVPKLIWRLDFYDHLEKEIRSKIEKKRDETFKRVLARSQRRIPR